MYEIVAREDFADATYLLEVSHPPIHGLNGCSRGFGSLARSHEGQHRDQNGRNEYGLPPPGMVE